jgi:predicted class III extradiol MEMO1 family dioxygenase
MAHVGARYGDQVIARANEGHMQEVAERDQARIRAIERGSAADFWSLVEPNQDDLKWCGSSPIYTFLKAVAAIKGRSRRYEQWNIDDQSVVSFAAIDFTA